MEPGCYFIDALLLPVMKSPETSKFLNQEVIKRFNGFGGVRIESDLVYHLLNLINAKLACSYLSFTVSFMQACSHLICSHAHLRMYEVRGIFHTRGVTLDHIIYISIVKIKKYLIII